MVAYRVSARALNTVSKGVRQTRHLHITEPAKLPARTPAFDKSPFGLPQDVVTLRAECKKNGLPTYGSRYQLVDRLSNSTNRAFSTSDSSYGVGNAQSLGHTTTSVDQVAIPQLSSSPPFTPTNQTRHFNTSRELKKVGDSSTIDFAYLPVFPGSGSESQSEDIRVPILPHNSRADGSKAPMASEVADITAKPVEISVVSGEGTHLEGGPSAMSDDHPHELDLQGVARQLALGVEREGGEELRKAKGLMKQAWTGFVDDLFGQKPQK